MHAWPSPRLPELPGRGTIPRLWDTDTASLRPSATSAHAGLYVCGITPYDATHLGHAKTYLTFDTLVRAWRDAGLTVSYAQNVTDVDDPLLERATATGVDWRELAAEQSALYCRDMEALRVVPPDAFVSVVAIVGDVADAVAGLIERGLAYRVDTPDAGGSGTGDVYADLGADPHFTLPAGRDRAGALAEFAAKGGDPDRPGKRDPLDPLLWREHRPGEPCWDGGELGKGRPGWHIECAVIAAEHLALPFDVLGGGCDLDFPHHAMSRSHVRMLTGERDPAHLVTHASMVYWRGAKMSKSRGNLVFVSHLLRDGLEPGALRLALLGEPHRRDWEWHDELADLATARLTRWRRAVARGRGPGGVALLAAMREHLADDLDTSGAIAAVDEWAQAALEGQGDDDQAPGLVANAVDALLGVRL